MLLQTDAAANRLWCNQTIAPPAADSLSSPCCSRVPSLFSMQLFSCRIQCCQEVCHQVLSALNAHRHPDRYRYAQHIRNQPQGTAQTSHTAVYSTRACVQGGGGPAHEWHCGLSIWPFVLWAGTFRNCLCICRSASDLWSARSVAGTQHTTHHITHHLTPHKTPPTHTTQTSHNTIHHTKNAPDQAVVDTNVLPLLWCEADMCRQHRPGGKRLNAA